MTDDDSSDEPKELIENDAMREARRLKSQKAARALRNKGWKTAAGIGVGSAAIAAAVMFVNRPKKPD